MLNEEQLVKALSDALAGQTEKMSEIVTEQVNAEVKRLGLDKLDAKYASFPGHEGDNRSEKREMAKNFFKGLFDHQVRHIAKADIKALNVNIGSEGGFLVPVEVYAEIARIAKDFGHIRAMARNFRMGSTELDVPSEGSRVSAFWVGYGSAGTVSNPAFKKPILEAKQLMGLSTVGRALLEDADVSVTDYLMETFGEAFAEQEDAQGFTGDGSPFVGLLNHDDISNIVMDSGADTFAEVSINNLIDLRTGVQSSVLSGGAYFMHRTVWGAILKITENSRHVLTYTNPQVALGAPSAIRPLAPVGAIDQYPVYLNDNMPALSATAVSTPFIVFGNMGKGMFFGDRQSVEMSMSEHAVMGTENAFTENKIGIRTLERCGIVVGLPGAFTRLVTAAS